MPGNPRGRYRLPLTERIKDGRIFEVSSRSRTGIMYLRCRTKFCSGTAKKLRNGDIVNHKAHSAICYEDQNAQLKANFVEALKSALERNFWRLGEIYENVAVLFPMEIKVEIPYNTIKSSMKRWRRRLYPPCPETLRSMGLQLEDPANGRLLESNVGRLSCHTINDQSGKIHLMLYDEQFVHSEFSHVSKILIDGTFQVTPQVTGVYQMISILGVKYDHAIPFVHILMSTKTQCGYTAVLTAVKDRLINSESVEIIMTDFEQALRNACHNIFRNAHVVGCNVHYDRALLKKIKSLRLAPALRNEDVKWFTKKIMALAYLPAHMIEAQYDELKTDLPLLLRRQFANFLTYYERQWLRIVKPPGFSVFGLSRRTNNAIESYNSILADKLGRHPNAWLFMVKLIKLTTNAREDLQSLRMNKTIRRHPRYSTIFKHRELTNAWRQLYANDLTPSEFIDKAAMLKGDVSEIILRIPDELLQHEAELETTAQTHNDDPDYDHEVFEDLPANDIVINYQPAQAPNHELDLDSSSLSDEPMAQDRDDLLEPQVSLDYDSASSVESRPEDGDLEMIDIVDIAQREEAPITFPQAPHEQLVEEPSVVEPSVVHESNQRVSASKKKNLKKKRRQQMKAQIEERPVRPYGHKRRKTRKTPKCVVCMGGNISYGFVPCGHNCCCVACASTIAAGEVKTCPKCRASFREIIRIFNE